MRELILEEAERQLRSGGWEALRFSAIAARLSTTRANLHYHFGNKQGLALAALERYARRSDERLSLLAGSRLDGDLEGFLADLERDLWQRLDASGYRGHCPCAQVLRAAPGIPEPVRERAREYQLSLLDRLASRVHAAQEVGAIGAERSPEALAREVLALHWGMAELAQIVPGGAAGRKPLEGFARAWVARLSS